MKNSKVKNQYSLFLLFVLLFFFSIYFFDFNAEIDNLYFRVISSQLIIPKKPLKKSITLIFVGDIMFDRGIEHIILKEGKGDYKFPFLKIADYLKEAEILFGNFEGPISDKGRKVGSIYSFRSNPETINGLVFAGFDVLSMANNHIFDYGREAMEDTFLRLKKAGIDYVGAGFNEKEAYSPIIKEIDGSTNLPQDNTKIAFLAYTNLGSEYWKAINERSGISWLEKERMIEEIKKAKNLADIVIVSFHYGEEYFLEPTSFQISISQTAIDAGADLVVGHHPHVIQPIKKYKSRYIAYSLGNFIFDQGFSEKTMKSLLLRVIIEDNEIKEVTPIEIKINKFFQPEIAKKL